MTYDCLQSELREARKYMMLTYGTPTHDIYKRLVRAIEKEMRLLSGTQQSA